jgi:hypothetical protein
MVDAHCWPRSVVGFVLLTSDILPVRCNVEWQPPPEGDLARVSTKKEA